jgi:hypothetical protein
LSRHALAPRIQHSASDRLCVRQPARTVTLLLRFFFNKFFFVIPMSCPLKKLERPRKPPVAFCNCLPPTSSPVIMTKDRSEVTMAFDQASQNLDRSILRGRYVILRSSQKIMTSVDEHSTRSPRPLIQLRLSCGES